MYRDLSNCGRFIHIVSLDPNLKSYSYASLASRVYPPGNWISRWGVVQGVHTGVWCQLALLGAVGGAGASGFQKCATGIAVVALLGLSGVGCVNEDENLDVHLTFASIYFGGAVGSGGGKESA